MYPKKKSTNKFNDDITIRSITQLSDRYGGEINHERKKLPEIHVI